MTEIDIKHDTLAQELALLASHVYADDYLGRYYKQPSEKHFPIRTLLNWTRTLAVEITESATPVLKAANWMKYFSSQEYVAYCSIYPDYIDFDDIELAILWGALYYWLKRNQKSLADETLLQFLEQHACPLIFLKIYFNKFKIPADKAVVLEEEKKEGQQNVDVHISNTFNAPVGQLIERANTIGK